MFICVHLCSLVFTCVLLVFICVHLCSLVFTCVPLVFICVLLMFICVNLCSLVFPLVWCFRLDLVDEQVAIFKIAFSSKGKFDT